MISINGVTIATPSTFDVGLMDLSKAERNANGLMILEIIATKRKLELGWKALTQAQLATLLSAISSTFFSVSYPDPQTGDERTGTFYKGDRKSGGMLYQGTVLTWKDIGFSLIER